MDMQTAPSSSMDIHFSEFDFQLYRLCTESGKTIADVCRQARVLGYTRVESSLERLRTPEFLEAVSAAGIRFTDIFFSPDLRVVSPDAVLEELLRAVERTKAPFAMAIPCEKDVPREKIYEMLRRFQKALADIGCRLTMEPFDCKWGDTNEFVSYRTLAGIQTYLENVPGLLCCFDSGNFQRGGTAWEEAATALQGKIANVHLKDLRRDELYAPLAKKSVDGSLWSMAPVGGGELHLSECLRKFLRDNTTCTFALEYGVCRNLQEAHRLSIANASAWLQECLPAK